MEKYGVVNMKPKTCESCEHSNVKLAGITKEGDGTFCTLRARDMKLGWTCEKHSPK